MAKKYIDADKLIANLERQNVDKKIIEPLINIINSLPQEHPELPNKEIAEYYYHKGLYEGLSQGFADSLKILDRFAQIKADPVIVIKQQEQLSEELKKKLNDAMEEN